MIPLVQFSLGFFSKITEITRFLASLSHEKKCAGFCRKNGFWLHFGRFFYKLIRSPWLYLASREYLTAPRPNRPNVKTRVHSVIEVRVTRLGEFSPNGRLFTFGQVFRKLLLLLFSTVKITNALI
jgi:hypothetical protein